MVQHNRASYSVQASDSQLQYVNLEKPSLKGEVGLRFHLSSIINQYSLFYCNDSLQIYLPFQNYNKPLG